MEKRIYSKLSTINYLTSVNLVFSAAHKDLRKYLTGTKCTKTGFFCANSVQKCANYVVFCT